MDLRDIKLERINVSFRNNWDKPIHRWYRFHAGCSYAYPEAMLTALNAREGQMILDGFSGSGTVLVSAKMRRMNAIGVEANPLYALISRVKTYWGFEHDLESNVWAFLEEIREFTIGRLTPKDRRAAEEATLASRIPSYIWRYFDRSTLAKLAYIKDKINVTNDRRLREFFLVALLSILVDISRVHHVGETIVFRRSRRRPVNIYNTLKRKLLEMCNDLRSVRDKRVGRAGVIEGDARCLNKLVRKEIDHVITHPSYPNNYNYLLRDRLPLYFMNSVCSLSDEEQLRKVLIGAVSKEKVEYEPVTKGVGRIYRRIAKTGDAERANAILEYFDSMSKFLEHARSLLSANGFCAMLVGNSYMRGVMIPTDRLLGDLAVQRGFKARIFNVRNRGDGAFQHIYNGRLYESVLILK